jgi:hypothetical protein
MGLSIAAKQRRKITGMVRVLPVAWIIVAPGIGKSRPAAIGTLVDMQGKKSCF